MKHHHPGRGQHENSKAAYAASDFGDREREIIRVISESAVPLTDREIAQRLDLERGEVQPRISTLINDDMVLAEGPKVRCSTTKKMVRTVVLVVAVQQAVL